jgi:predicted metal-binding membrane protein
MLANERVPRSEGLSPAFAAMRARLAVVVLLFALAGIGWWWTAQQMRGMDNGPWTGLGAFSWFLGIWVVMMAAMMFPSVAPTVALYSRMTRRRSPLLSIIFAAGYLVTWAVAGVVAFTAVNGVARISNNGLAWDHAGRAVAGTTLILAALYQLTPLKDACLGKCRMGAKNGAWCVGCCWALMASLFALGVMSVAWMVFVASLITIEKTIPWRQIATYGTALILLGLGVLILAAPDGIPLLTIPHASAGHMPSMGM